MDSMQRLVRADVASRLARRDPVLFTDANDTEVRQAVIARLGWIGLASQAREERGRYEDLAQRLIAEGARDVVLLGMGGSSLAALVFSEVFGAAPGYPALHVLDTTSPVTTDALTRRLDPVTTFFLVSSKSGTTIEPLSLYAIFRHWLAENLGSDAEGGHFVAITDPGTPLELLARTDGFRACLPAPPDVGGRFSALTAFGLVPAALLGIDLDEMLARADRMDGACQGPPESNPAAMLASWIANAASEGRDKLTLAASKQYSAFPLWIEQLVAESTGKLGLGIVPVVEGSLSSPSVFDDDRAVVVIGSEQDAMLFEWADQVRSEGHPVFTIDVESALDVGAEFVRWEYATAMLGHLLGINPFDEPDVGTAKAATLKVLEEGAVETRSLDVGDTRFIYGGAIEAPAEAPFNLPGGLRPAFQALGNGDYLALLTYLPYEEARLDALRSAAVRVGQATRRAVCLELGPRYLHSTGQLHKGGPDEGVFVIVTARDSVDTPVPGRTFTLARLHRAQAEGDFLALAQSRRRVIRVDLPDSMADSVGALARALVAAAESREQGL